MFSKFYFSQISQGGQIREFKNLGTIVIIIMLLKKKIREFTKSEIRESLNIRTMKQPL